MTFLFSCLAIHTEAFLFLCHSGWHIINSCLICCLRALLPMEEALNPYTAVGDKTPVGPLPPCFNNKTEESSIAFLGFNFTAHCCNSVHKCHLQPSSQMSRINSLNHRQIRRHASMLSLLQTKRAPRTSEAPLHLCDPELHQHLLPPQLCSPSLLSLHPTKKKSRDDPSVPLFLWPAPSPPPGCFLFQNLLRHPLHTQLVLSG